MTTTTTYGENRASVEVAPSGPLVLVRCYPSRSFVRLSAESARAVARHLNRAADDVEERKP